MKKENRIYCNPHLAPLWRRKSTFSFIHFAYITLILFFVSVFGFKTHAQESEYDTLLNYYLKSDSVLLDQLELELAEDTMNIMDLVDKLVNDDYRFSQLSIRLGYTSNITYAGRNFGVEQYGFGAGATFYHKSGLFADLSGFWNSDLYPKYNPTITTLGYLGNISKKWTYTLSYDHFFYNTPDSSEYEVYYPITNSLNASTYFDLGKFTIAADYSFLFGEETAHRVRGNLMYTLSKKNWGFIDRFVFMPMASILLGNAEIYQLTPIYPEMNLRTRYDIRQLMYEDYGKVTVNYLWHNNRKKYNELEQITYDKNKDELADYDIQADNVFGIMNYSISTPFYFYVNNFTFALSYHYNIPVALPGEELDLEPNSFINATLLYNIPIIKKKKKLFP